LADYFLTAVDFGGGPTFIGFGAGFTAAVFLGTGAFGTLAGMVTVFDTVTVVRVVTVPVCLVLAMMNKQIFAISILLGCAQLLALEVSLRSNLIALRLTACKRPASGIVWRSEKPLRGEAESGSSEQLP